MTVESMITFFEQCVKNFIHDDTLLILDSWPAFRRVETIQEILTQDTDFTVNIQHIPAHCTPICQPLDVHFNRMYKNFARKITEHAILHSVEDVLSVRNNVIKLHSLIHEQFTAPIFKPFIKYAWKAANYVDEHPGEFLNPVQYCFALNPSATCSITDCSNAILLRCAFCEESYFCFKHFYTEYHHTHLLSGMSL